MANPLPLHLQNLLNNLEEVWRLLEIHEGLSGSGPGRRHNLEILNRSALVLLVACLEAFLEDLARHAFDWMLANASEPTLLPARVLTPHRKDSALTRTSDACGS